MKQIITFSKPFVTAAEQILVMEQETSCFVNNAELKHRIIGLLGEFAVAKFLEGRYSHQRIVIPVGVTSRMGLSADTFGSGDIVTIDRRRMRAREVKVYEVKSTEGHTSKPLIRADQVEQYLEQGVDHVVTVGVKVTDKGAECKIHCVTSPSKILDTWRLMRISGGQEVYKET